MPAVHFNTLLDERTRRARLYAGDVFLFPPSAASLALCEVAAGMLAEALSPHDPEFAQFHLPVEAYAAIMADLKPRFIHHPVCKDLIRTILREHGCDETETYFDVPRLRTSTSDGYLTTGIAYAFHPHRDSWYSAPASKNAFWSPSKRLTWVCIPDPGRSVRGFGMNVAYMPRSAAISLTTNR